MKTILLIDDDEVCRQPTAELLRREHWNVLEAEDGEIGIALAIQHRPDVILCDLLMPRVNGYQVCRAVRDHLELRHTRLIVLTGRDYASDRKSALEAGADAYLVKPFDVTRLGEVLAELRSRGDSPSSPIAVPQTESGPHGGTLLRFWGVRGSIPSPGQGTVFFGGNTTCVELRTAGRIIVLDAGSGIRALGLALATEAGGQPLDVTLLLTHTHWDHIQGFPFFIPAYDARNRIHIYGYEGALNGLRTALAGQMESPYFPVALDEMPGNLDIREQRELHFDIDGLRVEACFTNHPGVCVAYKLHTPDGTVVFMPDNETKRGTPDRASGTIVPDPSESVLLDFIRGADVLIIDSQYTAEEYETHIHWGHGCIDEVVRLALTAGVRRLYTFHHDPAHDDRFISAMLMHARALVEKADSPMVVDAAREGLEIALTSGNVFAR